MDYLVNHPAMQLLVSSNFGSLRPISPKRENGSQLLYVQEESKTKRHRKEKKIVNRWFNGKLAYWKINGKLSASGHVKIDPNFKRDLWTAERIKKAFKGMSKPQIKKLIFDINPKTT